MEFLYLSMQESMDKHGNTIEDVFHLPKKTLLVDFSCPDQRTGH
jgi:hypothetical protein